MSTKNPCDVRVVVTGEVTQIGPEEYLGEDYPDPETHLVDGSFVEMFPCLYQADVDRTLADGDDSVYFRAEVVDHWDVYQQSWFTFLTAVTVHFLNSTSVTRVRANPGSYRKHPFFGMVAVGHFGGGLTPAAVAELARGFQEAEASGAIRAFREVYDEDHPEVGVVLDLFRDKVLTTASRDGMILFR